MHIGLHVTYPLFLSDFKETWVFLTDFRKILKYQISGNPAQRKPSCSMRTNRRTDKKKLIVAFRKFAKAPKNTITVHYIRYMHVDLRTHSSTHVPSFEVSLAHKHHNGLNNFPQQKRKIGTNNQVFHRTFSAILSFFQVSHTEGGTSAEGVREYGAEENIWA
jgi:hypothetical protein